MLSIPEKPVKEYSIGCIVARFQVDVLHRAQRELLEFVSARHEKVIVVLGVSPLPNTRKNPLPYEARRQMLLEEFPNVHILSVKNNISDETWSKNLDKEIGNVLTMHQTVLLYGSRDSFIKHYHGKFDTQELESDMYESGTAVRKKIAAGSLFNKEWRQGVIWASFNRYPTSYQAVDAAIFNSDKTKILLVRKPDETKYRFCGGFVDPKTPNLESNCRREVSEELHIEVDGIKYIGSTNIDDWRYRGEVDGVMTVLFECTHVFGSPEPDDDIEEAKWFDLSTLTQDDLMPGHYPLFEMLWKYIGK